MRDSSLKVFIIKTLKSSNMARTAAQRAARALRRKKNSVMNHTPQQKHKQQTRQKKKKQKKKQKNKYSAESMHIISDGVNAGVKFTNDSGVEQYYNKRMEKVCNITGSVAFDVDQQFYINPGNNQLFPIFSQIAATYEQYRINHLRFIWRSREYTASGSNVGAGLVLMATNFDPDDPIFGSDTEMENYWHCTSGPPFTKVMVHDVLAGHKKHAKSSGSRDATLNNYYVNYSSNGKSPISSSGAGAKFYDAGNFQLGTSGNVSVADVIGELWVEYSFTLIHPKQILSLTGMSHYSSYGTALTSNAFAGITISPGSTLPNSITFSGTTMVFGIGYPLGRYRIDINCTNTNGNAFLAVSGNTGGLLVNTAFLFTTVAGRDQNSFMFSTTTGAVTIMGSLFIDLISNNTTGSVSFNAFVTSNTSSTGLDVFVTSVPNSILTAKEPKLLKDDRVDALEAKVERLSALLSRVSTPIHIEEEEEQKEVELPQPDRFRFIKGIVHSKA